MGNVTGNNDGHENKPTGEPAAKNTKPQIVMKKVVKSASAVASFLKPSKTDTKGKQA